MLPAEGDVAATCAEAAAAGVAGAVVEPRGGDGTARPLLAGGRAPRAGLACLCPCPCFCARRGLERSSALGCLEGDDIVAPAAGWAGPWAWLGSRSRSRSRAGERSAAEA